MCLWHPYSLIGIVFGPTYKKGGSLFLLFTGDKEWPLTTHFIFEDLVAIPWK